MSQPVHTLYGGAHLFRADSAAKLGRIALDALDTWAPDAATFAEVFGGGADATAVRARVRRRLVERAIEDLRVDFEDGYGPRPMAEEDGHATAVGQALAEGLLRGSLPPRVGIRVKALAPETGERGLRTLRLVLERMFALTGGKAPAGFVVTLPKVTSAEPVTRLGGVLTELERQVRAEPGCVGVELMVEHPRALMDGAGACPLPGIVAAGRGRVVACHFGAYDYTAALGVAAPFQDLRHPACVHARAVMQLALAGTEVWVADGATLQLPVAPHRGEALTEGQHAENRRAVHGAWRRHAEDVSAGIAAGYHQGWDLHPAQVVSRLAATFLFYTSARAAMAERLRGFLARAAQATRSGSTFDDAATGQGLLNFFLRGIDVGALDEEVCAELGLGWEELRTRSFARIVAGRG